MAEFLRQGKQRTSLQVKDEVNKGKGTGVIEAILDVLLGEPFDSDKSQWCLWLLSGGKEPSEFLKLLKKQNASPVCGLVWNAQFVAYRCRDCAISPCMSLCADCFVGGNHEGHDFNMFRSQAGGACDCGDENVMQKQGFCSSHGSNRATKEGILPVDLTEIAKCIIPRLFLKIFDDFQLTSSEGSPSHLPASINEVISLLQQICEADAFRNITARAVLETIPKKKLSKQWKQNQPQSGESRLKPTNSTASGHSLVHSIPSSPPGFELMSVGESFSILDQHDLKPLQDLNFEISTISYLDFLMHTIVKYEFPGSLATFMLLLLPEPTYKESFTRSFCRNYMAIGKVLPQSRHPDVLSNHLVHVSVQLFSSEVLATTMVREEKLLDTLIAVLIDMIGGCLQSYEYVSEGNVSSVLVANCDHRILINHCYWPVASDLLNVLSHKKVVKQFFENETLMQQWMYLVTLVTGMNVNNRRIASHIQFEPRTYITSFSVEFESIAAVMWELSRGCNRLKTENDRYILKLIRSTEAALRDWYNFVPIKPSKSTVTFHLSLHRYLALFISQAFVRIGIDEEEVFPPLQFLAQCMEYPLRTLVAVSEIKAGYWVFNGFQMRGQALSYIQCHFCNSMEDVDLFFVQVAASKLDPDYFLEILIERFSLGQWFQFGDPVVSTPQRQDADKENSMLESFLSFILILLSQRVFAGLSDKNQCKKDLAALLCVSNKSHSQLSDLIPTKPGEANETSKYLESSLIEMADFKAPRLEDDVMQQGTYSPKDSVWDEHFDYLHILHRFFMPSEYQKAIERYTENMRQRGATVHSNCWPPFKDLGELHPSFQGLYRILRSQTLQKIIFFVLYKAVKNMNSVTEMMLINTMHLFYLALRSPKIHEQGFVPVIEHCKDKRMKIAAKCVDFLEQFADSSGFYGTGQRELHELNASLYNRLTEDDNYTIEYDSSKIEDAVTIMQHTLFSKNKFPLFEPMLTYLDSVIEEGHASILPRHLHHLQYLLSIISEDRYIFLKKLFLHWRRCASNDNVKITSYSFCKQRKERRGFPLLLSCFVDHYGWLFRIHDTKPDYPATVFDIRYTEGSIIDNASLPVCCITEGATSEDDAKADVSEKKQSLVSLLVALLAKLKETSKCVPPKISSKPVNQENCTAGDGTFHITKLMRELHKSSVKNEILIDELAPHIVKADGHNKRPGDIDHSLSDRLERRKKAMERQRKILEEFMSKQEIFKEQNISVDMDIEDGSKNEAVKAEREFDCVICGQTSSSSIDRPFGVAVLLQPTMVLGQRRKEDDNDVLPREDRKQYDTCGVLTAQRKKSLLSTFDKVAAGKALELGLDCGVHLQTCDHYLHIDCHQSYFKSLQEEHIRNFSYEQLPFDIQKGYFTCPLCRQPCNGVLPLLPDSIRRREAKKVPHQIKSSQAEITSLLKRYSEAGSLSPLTAKALEFTVLTASTSTFVSLLSNALKADGHPLTTSYSDRTIKEKFLILVCTMRTCLEMDCIETTTGNAQRLIKRSCLEKVVEILQFHAQCLDSPMIDIWKELMNDTVAVDASTERNKDHARIPVLLYDIPSLLIQFILTWPTWIAIDHFQCMLKVLFNVHVVQALVFLILKQQGEDSWTLEKSSQEKSKHGAYDLLSMVATSLANLKTKFSEKDGSDDDAMMGISHTLLSPQAIELKIQEFVLPFLRLAASLSHVLFDTPFHQVQGYEEFLDLATILGLVEFEDANTQQKEVWPTNCLNWPYLHPRIVIQSWCQQLGNVLTMSSNSDLAILPLNHNWSSPKLVSLPHSYDRLFQFYRKQVCIKCKKVPDDPAICLICGAFCCFRSSCCSNGNGVNECVKHSVDCGCGTGIFLIVSSSAVLVIRADRGCIWGSVYLDSFGEEDKDLRRGKPLFLSKERYEHLQQQWLAHSFDRSCKRWGLHNNKL